MKHDQQRADFSPKTSAALRGSNRRSVIARALVAIGLLSACSAGDSGGDDAPVAAVELSGTAEVAAVLAGAVNSPPNVGTGVALSTKGEAGATDAGTLQYRVPIWVPDGVRGMQPSMSIVHDSAGAAGLLGKKWGISGLSSIWRCQKTLAEDRATAPIKFSGDEFCLDGERLLRTTGAANNTGEFRTRKNPFDKIVVTSVDVLRGIQSFKIHRADGTIAYYGSSNASRLRFSAPWYTNSAVAGYYVDKIQDRFGNSVLFSYSTQTAMGPEVNELVPTKITWGATGDTAGQRSVQFKYVGGSTAGDSSHQRWIAGMGIRGGQRVESLEISGPDGAGNVPLLKRYVFGYNARTITGEQLLETITECDGSGWSCKRPTQIGWNFGTYSYERKDLTSLGVNDVAIQGKPAEYVNKYQRILVADLNRDGRDDIVYRAFRVSGRDICLDWSYRLAQTDGTFGPPNILYMDSDADPRCGNPQTTLEPFLGDLVFADVNRDGFPDILSPAGKRFLYPVNGTSPRQWSYGLYLNQAQAGNSVSFGPRFGFEDSQIATSTDDEWCEWHGGSVDGASPMVAIGDVDGDAYPEVIRPNYMTPLGFCSDNPPPSGGVSAFTLLQSGSTSVVKKTLARSISPENWKALGVSAIDVDGDGVSEILMDTGDGAGGIRTTISSPTMSTTINVPPANTTALSDPGLLSKTPLKWYEKPSAPVTRWLLDLNGDGLKDIAAVYAKDPTTIVTNISTAKGFDVTRSTTLPYGARVGQAWRDGYDNGGRVADYNLDGRQDIVLVDDGVRIPPGTPIASRTHQMVLLSDGAGGFTVLDPSTTPLGEIPIGDPADGYVVAAAARVAGNSRGYRTSATLDANGDGLPDFIQFEKGRLVLYLRQGKQPDLVNTITEGTGRYIEAGYAPAIDSTVYKPDPSACASDPDHFACLINGPWLLKSLKTSACGSPIFDSQTYAYTGGLYDRGGLGFIGFKQVETYGPRTNYVSKTFTLVRKITGATANSSAFGATYAYPIAFRPTQIDSLVDTPQGPNTRHYTQQVTQFVLKVQDIKKVSSPYSAQPFTVTTDAFDCARPAWNSTAFCGGTPRLLRSKVNTLLFDDFGNNTSDTTKYFDGSRILVQTDVEGTTYTPDTTGTWLVRLLSKKKFTSTTNTESTVRTTQFTPDLSVASLTNLPKGEVLTSEIEPAGTSATRKLTTYQRDSRGRLEQQIEKAVLTGETRTTKYKYEDADGVYVTTTTDAKGFDTRTWRHAGYGFVVQTDDPNKASTKYGYDTFGRLLSETTPAGHRSTTEYNDASAACGTESTLHPDGNLARNILVHHDAFGNELDRSTMIDWSRSVTTKNTYTTDGLLSSAETFSSTNPSAIQSSTFTYDDIHRPLTICRRASDGTVPCQSMTYDGLWTTTTNEASRVTRTLVDAMGRVAVVATGSAGGMGGMGDGIPDATYAYGPFSLLKQERVSDGIGQTDFSYDVLGRPTLVSRTGTGGRGTTYNAFGDVVGTHKTYAGDSTPNEPVTYGRDELGRLTSVTGDGVSRTLSWDAPASSPTTPAPNAKGKLVDVSNGSDTKIHFDYYANGLLKKKTWSAAVFNPMQEVASVSYDYDSMGRPSNVTYPKVSAWSNPLVLTYEYDSVNGDVSAIWNNADQRKPIWAIWGRNELGQPQQEAMGGPGDSWILRDTSTYLASGLPSSVRLTGVSGQVTSSYAYSGDGLPTSHSVSNVGAGSIPSYQSGFGYDNLRRLTSWTAATNAGNMMGSTSVQYVYDGDGNLTARNWSSPMGSGNVSYVNEVTRGGSSNRRVEQTGMGPKLTEWFANDSWGRVWDTPAITLAYNAADEVRSVVEKWNGQVDTIFPNETGGRLATAYGNPSNGQPWSILFTFDDLTEINQTKSGFEERCRIRANGKLVGELSRTTNTPTRSSNFYLTDNVGSVLAETSATGAVTARARRDPYGNLIVDSTAPYLLGDPSSGRQDGSGRLGFGDHVREDGWGLVDMGARFYSPKLGRFMAPDPVIADAMDRRSHNAFAYIRNNPVAGSDPLGMADNMSDNPGFTAAAAAMSTEYGSVAIPDDVKKRRSGTGLTSDYGGMSTSDDGGGGNGKAAATGATLVDDLNAYDQSSYRRKRDSYDGAGGMNGSQGYGGAGGMNGHGVDPGSMLKDTADFLGPIGDGSAVGGFAANVQTWLGSGYRDGGTRFRVTNTGKLWSGTFGGIGNVVSFTQLVANAYVLLDDAATREAKNAAAGNIVGFVTGKVVEVYTGPFGPVAGMGAEKAASAGATMYINEYINPAAGFCAPCIPTQTINGSASFYLNQSIGAALYGN